MAITTEDLGIDKKSASGAIIDIVKLAWPDEDGTINPINIWIISFKMTKKGLGRLYKKLVAAFNMVAVIKPSSHTIITPLASPITRAAVIRPSEPFTNASHISDSPNLQIKADIIATPSYK